MEDGLAAIPTSVLPTDVATDLEERGFVVLPGPIPALDMPRLQRAYDEAVASAPDTDVRVGRSSTRVTDFVNRGPAFDPIYTWPPALEASRRLIGGAFRLSAMHARTLRPGTGAQELHVDVPPTSEAWPMLGLILMVDAFGGDNGATRFVPGSHRWREPDDLPGDAVAPRPGEVLACGPAGSVILFNASTWHGHTANRSDLPRRSIQATFIPRDAHPVTDFVAHMAPETRSRLSPMGRYLVGLEE